MGLPGNHPILSPLLPPDREAWSSVWREAVVLARKETANTRQTDSYSCSFRTHRGSSCRGRTCEVVMQEENRARASGSGFHTLARACSLLAFILMLTSIPTTPGYSAPRKATGCWDQCGLK